MKKFVHWRMNRWHIRDEARHRKLEEVRDDPFALVDVEFRVSEKGRDFFRNGGHVIIHAGAIGDPCPNPPVHDERYVEVRYHPKKDDTFVRIDNGEPVKHARRVVFEEGGHCWALLGV